MESWEHDTIIIDLPSLWEAKIEELAEGRRESVESVPGDRNSFGRGIPEKLVQVKKMWSRWLLKAVTLQVQVQVMVRWSSWFLMAVTEWRGGIPQINLIQVPVEIQRSNQSLLTLQKMQGDWKLQKITDCRIEKDLAVFAILTVNMVEIYLL